MTKGEGRGILHKSISAYIRCTLCICFDYGMVISEILLHSICFSFFAFSNFLDGWSSISAVYIYGKLRITTEKFDLQLWISINPCRSNTDHCRNNIKRNLSEYFFLAQLFLTPRLDCCREVCSGRFAA